MNTKFSFQEAPVVVLGAGVVGLFFAAILQAGNIKTIIIETKTQTDYQNTDEPFNRAVAINRASKQMLEQLGIWSQLPKERWTPLHQLVVWEYQTAQKLIFDSTTVARSNMGFIVDYDCLRQTLYKMLAKDRRLIRWFFGVKPLSFKENETEVILETDCGHTFTTPLMVGADGINSWLRASFPPIQKNTNYSAVTGLVSLEKPHKNQGHQLFMPEEVVALLPLPQINCAALIWSLSRDKLKTYPFENRETLNQLLTEKTQKELGNIQLLTTSRVTPLTLYHLSTYFQKRRVLIGDAAHSIHPLAGQGLNLGLMDAAVLGQCMMEAKQHKRDIGHARVLSHYTRWCHSHHVLMNGVIEGLLNLYAGEKLKKLRAHSLGIFNRRMLLKNYAMRFAMGETGELPELAQYEYHNF